MKFTVATLTCNDRQVLFNVIGEMMKNTNMQGIEWMIYAQGCSEEFLQKIRETFENTGVILRLVVNPENEGYSKGMNNIWKNVNEYDYVLFIEDDWRFIENENKDWLKTCLECMQENNVDIIFLRKYLSDEEKYHYGWTRHIPYVCFEGRLRFNYEESMKSTTPFNYKSLTFQQIPEFMYSANPCIYNVESFKRCNVFPMIELNDIHNVKGEWGDSSKIATNIWGCAEALSMEKTANLYTLYLKDGLFYHNS